MEQLTNRPVTTLNGAINNSTTTVVITSATDFPTVAPFTIKIETELMRVTAISTTTLTVTRGAESTTAASHANSVSVTAVVSNQVLQNLFKELYQIGGYSSRPSSAREGTVYQATDVDLKWRYNGTQWDLIHPTYVPYASRLNTSGWTSLNFGSTVWTEINGVLVSTLVDTSQIRGKYHAVPTPPYTITACFGPPTNNQTSNLPIHGIMLYDGTKVKIVGRNCSNRQAQMIMNTYTTVSTGVSTVVSKALANGNIYWVRFEDDNTNWNYYLSYDGYTWFKFYNETRNTFLTPTQVGIGHERTTFHNSFPLYWPVYAYLEA